jgi:Uma2 family endonuclease
VAIVAYEFNLPIKSVGATTRRKRTKSRGLEPDESFFVQHEPAVRGRRSRSSTEGPAPDLAIEVEITHKDLDRLEAYEKLGVSEVWRYRDGIIEFYQLQAAGGYLPTPRSAAFPLIHSSQLTELLTRLDSTDETSLMHEFIATLRSQR